MFELDNKSAMEWRKKIEDINEENTNKLVMLQKELDKSTYEYDQLIRESERMELALNHVLDYFMNERGIEVSAKDVDLFYLEEILEKFYTERRIND